MRVRYSFSSRKTGRLDPFNTHSVPFPKMVKQVVGMSDVILEILDARFVEETRNPEIEDIIKACGKKIVYVLNKVDLVDLGELKKKVNLLGLHPYVFVSCKARIGSKDLRDRIKIEVKKVDMEMRRRAQVGIVGYPNTGKSSIINLITGKNAAPTAAEAGFTKGIQKIKLASNILVLDTPGIIPEKEYLQGKAVKQAQIGVHTWDNAKDPDFLIHNLMEKYPGVFENFYGISSEGDSEKFLETLGRKKSLLRKGNEVDMDRTARQVLKDWQSGKIKIDKAD